VAPLLRMFGRPCIEGPGGTVEPPFGKAWALLLVLARRATWVPRAELVYLFWPDHEESQARANLRKLLSRNVAALPFSRDVEVEPSRLRWGVETDVRRFEDAIACGRLAQALDLYRGEFLEGVHADALPEFEAWVEAEREELAAAWRHAGTSLAEQAAAEGRREDAARVLATLVAADPLDEEALQAYLHALAAAGRHAAGLDAFRTFAERLEREFGETPSRETREIAASLRDAAPVARPASRRAQPHPNAPRALPTTATPFVGRDAERLALAELLRRDDCRLVTLTAPGGFGKTRLALAAAADVQGAFRDGVAFVPFTTVPHRDAVPFAIAEALGLTISGRDDPFEQLADLLRSCETLLVLDDLEHLADDVRWLGTLLDAAPSVRALVTSTRLLDLAAEWRFELGGMRLPEATADPRASDAVRLFLETASRHDAAAAAAAPIDAVVRLCRAVEGMPLALVLAAPWLGTLGMDDLIAALEHDPGALETRRADLPERQRNLDAVVAATLAHLSDEAGRTFVGLGAFPGSFDAGAAAAVAGASPHVLRELIARNVVATAGGGRYRVHALLRREATRRLSGDPATERAARDVHARHYAAWLSAIEPDLQGRAPAATLTQLDLERDNVTDAFLMAVSLGDLEGVERMAADLETYFVQRTHFAAGATLYLEASRRLGENDPARAATTASLLVWAGWLEFRRGRFDDAQELLTRARRLQPDEAHARRGDRAQLEGEGLQGALKGVRGDLEGAWEHHDRALALARAAHPPAQVAIALNSLAITEKQLGLFHQSEAHVREALALNRALGASFHAARNLNNLGHLLLAVERVDEAAAVLEEGLALAHRASARQVLPHILGGLAKVALARGEAAQARATAAEAWETIRAAGVRGSGVDVLVTLALASAAEGDVGDADRALAAAVADAAATQGRLTTLAALAAVGRVRALRGDHRHAAMALSLVREDPGLEHGVRAGLGPSWRACVEALGSAEVAAAQDEAASLGVERLLARLVPRSAAADG
jgi:predicted ATPase/DNA-binding SARP family transcriptional activator